MIWPQVFAGALFIVGLYIFVAFVIGDQDR